MFIKSIVLDGFKSYGNRVEITGFDPEFNAITGLNGTGKSNILDSICFVLGITNLSNVRAGSLQELIYKHGQAGITKATVSITFDNRDKNQCPIGYENHDEITVTRQVVMGGKNKYLINGINVQNKRVSDLFCSVQLNVNNPHFLIMQGRITKVLNMKPPEILAMVEEAAGTRMYESKKQAALKTIEKKDAKLRELNDIIKEDIAPKLQKLQDERSQFQEYQKVVRELENLTRLCIAWKYTNLEKSAVEADAKVTEVKNEIQSKKDQVKEHEKVMKKLEQEIKDINKKLDEESGSVLQTVESALAAGEQREAASGAELRAAKDALTAHARRAKLAARALHDEREALAEKTQALDKVSSTFEELKAASDAAAKALTAAQERFLAVSSGLEGGSESLQDQFMEAKRQAMEASTGESVVRMELQHGHKRLQQLRQEFSKQDQAFRKDREQLHDLQNKLAKAQEECAGGENSAAQATELQAQWRAAAMEERAARDAHDATAARLQRTDFRYSDPHPGFDRSKVQGVVSKLFSVRDPVYCTALETVAGGRLYNVVVDTDETSRLLLQKGQLRTRTTIIPLNKISGRTLPPQKLMLAQQIGGGPENVQLAIDLIQYAEHLEPAMRYIFGDTLVCKDLNTARLVTFDRRVSKRTVTLDGDVFDPAGTLSGGARQSSASVLLQLQELRGLQQKREEAERRAAGLAARLSEAQRAADSHAAAMHRRAMIEHEFKVAKARMAASAHGQLHEDIEALEKSTEELAQRLLELQKAHEEAAARAADLEEKVRDIKGHREREFKKAESELAAAKREAQRASEAWKVREQEHDMLKYELDELRRTVETSSAAQEDQGNVASQLQAQVEAAQAHHEAAAAETKELQRQVREQKAALAARSSQAAEAAARREQLAAAARQAKLAAEELAYKATDLTNDAEAARAQLASLEREHSWVAGERQYFGQAGGLYDWQARDAATASARRSQLAQRKEKLSRGLNARAHTLLGKEEEQYQDVVRKKSIVEGDRSKLVQVMAELDEKKRRTLVMACEQVNRSFGAIFGALLPGAGAELAPPEGGGVLDGLQVRVAFNGTWKESLAELSGGQRSLVALSLVLAMLQFKPAPLYILDEVDAALDLSHTQNIGNMLRDHFNHSQFIIVSLKDGMFNNANVLFRTKFVDGMSAVQRTANARR